jgi:N-acetyl-anhydromuramyl-L-alanine amidase AmpD
MAIEIHPVSSYKTGSKWIKNSARTAAPDLIVLHETAGASGWSSYEWGIKQATGYHFIIDRPWPKPSEFKKSKYDGYVWQAAPVERRTNHVGSTVKVGNNRSINDRSIGISFANMSDGSEARTQKQRQACLDLINHLVKEYPSIKYITTHYDLQIWNRHDPLGFEPFYVLQEVGLAYLRPSEQELIDAAEAWAGSSTSRKFAVPATRNWILGGRKAPR